MKKTLIALMALAGVASAYTTTVTPLTLGGWTLDPSNQLFLNDGVLSAGTYLHWSVGTATQAITTTLGYETDYFACTTETDTLSFSFDVTNNGTGNSCLTLALMGTSNAIVLGHGTYDKPADQIQVAVTDNVSVTGGYIFANTNPEDDLTLTAGATLDGSLPTGGVTTTINGTIAWDGDSYALTVGTSAVTETVTYDLGLTSVDVQKLMVTLEGGDNGGEDWDATPTVTNLTITGNVIPEPATATLSLLALAGLAARRRRK